MPDVYKILKDLELKAVGLDEKTQKMQEGYFSAFRDVGLPIHKEDFENPYSPLGVNLQKAIPQTDAADPKDAPKTASGQIDQNKIFTAGIAHSMQSYLNTFLLTDDKLQMSNRYTVIPSSSKVSDSWYAIITGANGVPTKSELNAAQKAALDAAAAKLVDKDGNPTPHYQAYMDREAQWKDAMRAWNRAYAAAFTDPMKLQQWPNEGKLYDDDATEAMNRWVSFGFKGEIDSALNILSARGVDPAIALINRAKTRFQNSLLEFQNVGQIPYTIILPNSWYDPDNDDGWTDYTMDDYKSESHYNESGTSYGASVGINAGFWSASGGFEHSENRQSLKMSGSNLTINFKYCVADIKRPWLDTSLLNLSNWFLMGDYKKNCISTGKMAQELPAQNAEPTFLPSVVTSFVLVKDLLIKWDNWEAEWDEQSSATGGSFSVGFGPFALSGNYSHHNVQRDFKAEKTGEGLLVHGVQLLGYVSTILPASPSVDSAQFLASAGAGGTK